MNNVDVIYTMWSNLKKTPGMEPGQVSFFKDKEVGVGWDHDERQTGDYARNRL